MSTWYSPIVSRYWHLDVSINDYVLSFIIFIYLFSYWQYFILFSVMLHILCLVAHGIIEGQANPTICLLCNFNYYFIPNVYDPVWDWLMKSEALLSLRKFPPELQNMETHAGFGGDVGYIRAVRVRNLLQWFLLWALSIIWGNSTCEPCERAHNDWGKVWNGVKIKLAHYICGQLRPPCALLFHVLKVGDIIMGQHFVSCSWNLVAINTSPLLSTFFFLSCP